MDILTDDQSFHGSLGRDLGFDNPALDFPTDLEDIIFKGDGPMCIPDDVISHGIFDNNTYTTGSNGSCGLGQNSLSGQGQDLIHGHGHLGDPQDRRHMNGLVDQLSQQLQHQQQLQQQYQQQQQHQNQQQSYHSQHQPLHNHSTHHSSSCEHEGHQQQQQNSSYCSISGQPHLSFDSYDHSLLGHTSLPDSPPDSGSEPYSPPDGNIHHQAMTDLKSTIPGSLPTIPQSMYLGHNNRLGGMPPNKVPPAYIGEPPKLNHHHQGPSLQQQQDQQQQSGLRGPLPYPAGLPLGQHLHSHQISPPLSHSIVPAHMGSMSNIASQVTKKRKYSDSPTGTLNSGMIHGMNGILSIKQEPPGAQFSSYIGECSGGDDDMSSYDLDSNGAFIDSTYQVIKWQPYSQPQWAILTDGDLKDLPTPQYRVDADKGFNYSVPDEAFVCQKKNHFQVTVHMRLQGNAKYIRTVEGVKKIESYYLHFYGVKMESQNQQIKIEQSQSDRSKKSFHPVRIDLPADQETKVTVGRLHFSETTSNNMRKKGKPNPDQRYFLLVVSLHAHSGDKDYILVGSISDRIIVRASNPGQFDSDVDVTWQKGQTQESVYHMGRVGINTDHPEEALTVHGNMRLTGHLSQPSDMRAKKNIEEINPKNQLENVSKLRIYKYSYREDYATHAGIPPGSREDTGVLAQEILDVLPDAVHVTGDIVLPNGEIIENFLVVNKDRIFMENVGAVKELCKLTDNLEVRIDQLEKMNKRLGSLKRFGSLKSTSSNLSAKSASTLSSVSSVVPTHKSRGPSKNTSRGSGHNGSNCSSSHGNSLNDSKSVFGSLLSWPFQKRCNSWFRYIIIGLILLMAFCLAALACLYILEVQKPDSDNSVASAQGPDFGSSTSTETVLPTVTTRGTLQPVVTTDATSLSTAATSTMRNNAAVTSRSTESSITSQTLPTYSALSPVVPPYPPCSEGYCEKICCPAPHEDEPVEVYVYPGIDSSSERGESNNSGLNGEEIEVPDDADVPPITKSTSTTRNRPIETIVINNIPGNGQGTRNPEYNVINNIAKNPPEYAVINQNDNRNGKDSLYHYRRRRGAEDAPRPTVKILELNYIINDDYCDPCSVNNNNYVYFVPYNSSFGYEPITLEFLTPTMSYMALCNSSFMWTCPDPATEDTEIGGLTFQQTNNATWTLKLGTHFRTILTFRVIHSLKGKPVTQACSLQSNQDYVVMSYTLRFQRQC